MTFKELSQSFLNNGDWCLVCFKEHLQPEIVVALVGANWFVDTLVLLLSCEVLC